MVAQLHAKRSLFISRRMSARVFNKITSMTKQPSELLSTLEELKKAIGNLTSIPSIPGTISSGFRYQNTCLRNLEDQTPWQETRKPSVEVPQMSVQPSKVQDGIQASATTSDSSDSRNQVLATAAFNVHCRLSSWCANTLGVGANTVGTSTLGWAVDSFCRLVSRD